MSERNGKKREIFSAFSAVISREYATSWRVRKCVCGAMRKGAVYHQFSCWRNNRERNQKKRKFSCLCTRIFSHFIFLHFLPSFVSDDVSQCLLMLCINFLASFSSCGFRRAEVDRISHHLNECDDIQKYINLARKI